MSKSARCQGCGIRPIGGGKSSGYEDPRWAKQNGWCLPCADEGQMDIAHTNGHESISEDECWYCHPELDARNEEYIERAGTSRAGMVLNVAPLDAAKTKAGVVVEALEAKGFKATVRTAKGLTTLRATLAEDVKLQVTWEGRRYTSGTVNGRRLRNVADVLRYLNA